jgi:predicted amidohydrolase
VECCTDHAAAREEHLVKSSPEDIPQRALEREDEFRVIERTFSSDPTKMSVGLANINAAVPDVGANKDKIARVAAIFKERGVNVAVFPEFALSGYFWDDEQACRTHMDSALTEQHVDWIEDTLKPLLDDDFRYIILNNLMHGPDGKYYNSTFPIARDYDYLNPDNSYQKIFLPGIEKTYTASGKDDRLVIDTTGRQRAVRLHDLLRLPLRRPHA